jgi:hypothetical protein
MQPNLDDPHAEKQLHFTATLVDNPAGESIAVGDIG